MNHWFGKCGWVGKWFCDDSYKTNNEILMKIITLLWRTNKVLSQPRNLGSPSKKKSLTFWVALRDQLISRRSEAVDVHLTLSRRSTLAAWVTPLNVRRLTTRTDFTLIGGDERGEREKGDGTEHGFGWMGKWKLNVWERDGWIKVKWGNETIEMIVNA